MAANVDIEKQFLRLIMFCHKISLPVVRTFFVSGVLGCPDYSNDICTFLEHHKHEIFHLVGDYKCCQCTNLPSLQTRTLKFRLGNDQFKKLYDVGLSQPGHFSKGSGGRVFQQCLCCVTVRINTNPKTYDISLLFAILYSCVQLSESSISWLDTIRKGRNRLCHLNDINDLSEIELHTLWGNLERSVISLAGEIPSQPCYKESIEQHVDTFKYTDYNKEDIIPIIESMRSEINNNINGVIQNQKNAQEELRCLTTHVEQLSENCKKDNHDMFKHVSASANTIIHTHQDAVHQLSAQVAKCHLEEVELLNDQKKAVIKSSQKVIGIMEHAVKKIHFLVNIHNCKSQCRENDDTLPKLVPAEERSTHIEQKYSEEPDIQRCKLHWRIETPGYLEHIKEDMVKAMKNAIAIVKIGTSHEIEDINEGSITIDTLLPMSILQDKKAFHHSIRKFLEAMVSVCGIDTKIPLVVKVQITLSDLDQGSVKYSIEELKHTTKIDKDVQAVPTMLDRSTESMEREIKENSENPDSIKRAMDGSVKYSIEELKHTIMIDKAVQAVPTMLVRNTKSRELEIKENSENPDSIKRAMDEIMIYSVNIKDNVLIPPSEMAFLQKRYDNVRTYEDKCMLLMGCSNDIRWIESVLTFIESVTPICKIEYKEKSKKLLNSENINTFIYIASKSSQRSHNFKSMLECLSESKSFLNKVITVVRDDVVISDMLKESKQILVKIKEKDWLPDLMDAIASSGAILYSVINHHHSYADYTDRIPEKIVLILGNFKNVKQINSILSEYSKHKMPIQKYEIRLQTTSSVLRNIQRLSGIIYVISEDLKEDFCSHPDIIQLMKRTENELAVLINHMTLPQILKGIKQIDATDNNEDWIPNLIDEMLIRNSMVYTLKLKAKKTCGFPSMSRYKLETGLFLLIGNTKEVQWFFSALSESERVERSMVELLLSPQSHPSLEILTGLICITGENLETYLNQLVDVTAFKAKEIVTLIHDEMTIPDMLKETKLVDARGTDCKWLSDLIDCLHRLMSVVYILRFNNGKFLHDDYDDDIDGLILLMGNSKEVQQFYTTLVNSEIARNSKLILQCVSARKLNRRIIKSIICIVTKSSKDEDFLLDLRIKDLECWPNNVVTLVREQTIVPNLLKTTKQIVETGQDEMWLSDVMDVIHRSMSIVYIMRFNNGNLSHGHLRYLSREMYSIFNRDDDDDDDGLILLMGNYKEVQQFYTTLVNSENAKNSKLILQCVSARKLNRRIIKSIICIVAKSSKDEDFLLDLRIEDLECWPNNVVTLVREQTIVPNLLKTTKQIFDTGQDEMWLSDVMYVIKRSMSKIYVLSFTVDINRGYESYVIPDGDDHKLILIMANTEEVLRFHSLLKAEHPIGKAMKLQLLPSRKLRTSTIKGIICILSKSSKAEELFLQHKLEDFECWPNDVVTVLRDETTVPKLFEGTIQIKETGKDKKWISDVVDVINRTMSMVYLLRICFAMHGTASHVYFNDDCGDVHGGDALILLLGNTEEICRFKSVLMKSGQNRYSTTEFIHMPSRQILKSAIKAIICFISKYSKTEELILQYKLMNFERKPDNVVTVMRDQMTVPKMLEGTKLINDAGEDDKWVSDVMVEIKKALLMVYVLRFSDKDRLRYFRYKDYDNESIVLMGTEEDVEWFYWQVVRRDDRSIYSKMILEHIPGRQLYRTTVKVIICIISKSSKEEECDMLQKMVYFNGLTNDVVTVVRDKMTVPKFLEGTKLINDTGEDCKWISDVLDEIKRTRSRVILKSHSEEERYNPGFRYDSKTVMNKGDGFKNVNPVLKKRSEID